MVRRWPVNPIHEGHARIRTSTSAAWYEKTTANYSLIPPSRCCPCLYLSIYTSVHPFKAVNCAKIAKNWTRMLGDTPTSKCMLRAALDDVTGDFSQLDRTDQSASISVSCDWWRKNVLKFEQPMMSSSNVVLPIMCNKEKFIQLANIHLPTPCITPGGIVSNNKIVVSLQ